MTQRVTALPRGHAARRGRTTAVYLAVTLLVIACWALSMLIVYPRKLMFSAPDLTGILPAQLLTHLPNMDLTGLTGTLRYQAYEARDLVWRGMMTLCQAAGLVFALLTALAWRWRTGRRPLPHTRAVRRAIATYHLDAALIALVQAALGYLLWRAGLSRIQGAGAWDYLVCLGPLLACALSSHALFRLGAPGVLSGRHGYFVRL